MANIDSIDQDHSAGPVEPGIVQAEADWMAGEEHESPAPQQDETPSIWQRAFAYFC